MRAPLAALPGLVLALAACGDTLVDHRDVQILNEQPVACGENLVACGSECRSQTVGDPGWVCGMSCTPCPGSPPANATLTCTPVGAGGHDGVCGYACDPGLLRCASGCCPAALVAAGGEFACAATSAADGGEVHCWGAGDQGQLGDGVGVDRPTSAKVPGLSGVTALAAGVAHACAASGGKTYCWGDRAGFGGLGVAPTPEEVPELAGATGLSSGAVNTCGIVAGSVTCTGAAVGGGGTPGLSGAVEIASGDAFSCALLDSGGARSVACWGDDAHGELGDGTSGSPSATPLTVAVPASVQHVAAGARHACASNDAAGFALYCWGDNTAFQLGTFPQTILGPTQNDRVKKAITSISAGGLASCAVEQDAVDTLSCWAQDDLAAGGAAPDGEPNQIAFGSPPGPVSTGGAHTCFVEAGATPPRLRCFGHDDRGQLGNDLPLTSNANPDPAVIDR